MAKIEMENGEERELRLTVGTLQRFERRSGVKLFKALAREMEGIDFARPKDVKDSDAMKLFTGVFPGISEVSAFLYECCVPKAEQKTLSYDDFCDDLPATALGSAFSGIMEEVTNFMPEAPDAGGAEGKPGDPLGS